MEEIGFIEVRKPPQPCSDSRAPPRSSLSRHRLEGRFSSLFLAECLASPLEARLSSIRGRKPAAATILTGAARAFSWWTAWRIGRPLGRQALAALDGIPTRCPGFGRQQVRENASHQFWKHGKVISLSQYTNLNHLDFLHARDDEFSIQRDFTLLIIFLNFMN